MPSITSTITVLFGALVALTSAMPATAEKELGNILAPRACNVKCSSNQHCYDLGCGACLSGTNLCANMAPCNSRFTNCKRTVDYDIAVSGGKVVERDDGSVWAAEDALEYVAEVLKAREA